VDRDKKRGEDDTLEGTLGTWVDMLLLALSDAVVLSRSGYSESAAEIGMFPSERILRWKQCLNWVDGPPPQKEVH